MPQKAHSLLIHTYINEGKSTEGDDNVSAVYIIGEISSLCVISMHECMYVCMYVAQYSKRYTDHLHFNFYWEPLAKIENEQLINNKRYFIMRSH